MFRRDKFEREFGWTKRHAIELGYFIFGVTAGLYSLSVWATRHSDRRSGYPKREMLGHPTGTGFVMPDERDWWVLSPLTMQLCMQAHKVQGPSQPECCRFVALRAHR